MSMVGSDERLEAARAAARRHEWHDAFRLFSELEAEDGLEPLDLEVLADIAWFNAEPERSTAAREKAFARYLEAGARDDAARVALRVARDYDAKLAKAQAKGWVGRAERLLKDLPEGRGHGYLLLVRFWGDMNAGRFEEAAAVGAQATDIGARTGDPDLEGYGLMLSGMALVSGGKVEEGLALLDEATIAAVGGELSPFATGIVYCNVISTCRDLADYRRAGEWTEAAKRWCERQSIRGFPGICRVHRAEIIALRGAWDEAVEEAELAAREVMSFNSLGVASEGFYAVGEIRLRMGELDAAEQAFRQALELGRNPQPGMGLLRLAQGRVEEAVTGIRTALADRTFDRLARSRLLPAAVEACLVAGDVAFARAAADELSEIAEAFESAALHAAAHAARGAVLVAEGRGAEAIEELSLARRHWQETEVPYEVARVRVDLAKAYRLAGDLGTARLEMEAAVAAFDRLGARIDAERAERALKALAAAPDAERAERAFVFTDIVGSTQLLELIGDAAWQSLRDWHDERVRALVARHGGEVVNHTGDGFFLAFPDTGAAIDFAVGVQRALADHRRASGFAPRVRIGVHAAEAAKHTEGYLGKGVHAAARVGALADAEEILVSSASLPAEGLAYPIGDRRTVDLKGLSEPIEVAAVDWRPA